MNRQLIGLIAIVLLVMGALMPLIYPENGGWTAAFLRIGVVMGVAWLAYPQLALLPVWLIGGILIALLVVAKWPKLLLLALAALAVAAVLRPRPRGGNSRPRR